MSIVSGDKPRVNTIRGNAHKDNIHWFLAESDVAFIFNIHVIGYDPKIKEASGRLYLDPDGEKLSGGTIKAPKMTSAECHKKVRVIDRYRMTRTTAPARCWGLFVVPSRSYCPCIAV